MISAETPCWEMTENSKIFNEDFYLPLYLPLWFQLYLSMPPLAQFSWIFPFESAPWYPFSTWCTEALWQGWSDSPFVGRLLWNLSHTPAPACRRKGKNPTWALEAAECRRTGLCHKQEHTQNLDPDPDWQYGSGSRFRRHESDQNYHFIHRFWYIRLLKKYLFLVNMFLTEFTL